MSLADVNQRVPASSTQRLALKQHRVATERRGDATLADAQGVHLDWFMRGIDEQNCALFEAAFYPVLPELWSKTQQWLVKNHPDCSEDFDAIHLHLLVDDLLVMGFEQSRTWRPDIPVVDWIVSFIGDAFAVSEQADRILR